MQRSIVNLLLIAAVFSAMVAGQWNLDRIDQRVGLDGLYNYSSTGRGVTAYVVDSGVQISNPEFEGRASDGYGRYRTGCNGHGTGVAGVIGSRSYGVAKEVLLVSVQVLPCTGSTVKSENDIVRGLDWILRDMKRSGRRVVVNISFQVIAGFSNIYDRLQQINDAGGVIVIGAGNDSDDACRHPLASFPNAIVVGGTRSDDTAAPWSNYGSCVDLYAPGEGVWTTWTTAPRTFVSGTSYSAPHVTGLAAIYLERNPFASSEEVRDAIVGNATPDVILGANPNLFIYTL
jgi:aqualysin 1